MPKSSFEQLIAADCRPMEGGQPMREEAIEAQLEELPDWVSDGKRIERSYRFTNYWETIACINAIAWMVHREDHHPEMLVGYNKLTVRFDTHTVGGVSPNDFICAAKCDALYDDRPRVKST